MKGSIMHFNQQQSRALFVIGSALFMFTLVLIPSLLVYFSG
jgi:hypothetical protein